MIVQHQLQEPFFLFVCSVVFWFCYCFILDFRSQFSSFFIFWPMDNGLHPNSDYPRLADADLGVCGGVMSNLSSRSQDEADGSTCAWVVVFL